MKRNDLLPEINATLRDANGTVVDLTGASLEFHMFTTAGASKVNTTATIVSAAAGTVKYTWVGTDTDTAGEYNAEWEVTFASTKPQTFPNSGHTTVTIVADLA